MKLAVITCYKQPDYIRAETLRLALSRYPGIDLIVIKNNHTGLMRYPEVLFKVAKMRIKKRPDVYLLTFRGYEILPALTLMSWPKPFIFDEFINPLEWLYEPQQERWVHLVPKALLRLLYGLVLKRCKAVLADTEAHINSSSNLNRLSRSIYWALPVSTNERLFKPVPLVAGMPKSDNFQVLYYGNMRPLHGLKYVLKAAILLKGMAAEFVVVGGGKSTEDMVAQARRDGATIVHHSWVPFEQLPTMIRQADLCLGGPFGDTSQARQVITGKTYQFLASQKPTVVGQNQATRLFVDKYNCLLVPLGSDQALATAINWSMHHREQLEKIGQEGLQLYRKSFSLDILAQKVQAMLQKTLNVS